MPKKILRNRCRCLACGKILESTSGHNFVSCGCANETATDGGLNYIRRLAKDFTLVEDLTEYAEK